MLGTRRVSSGDRIGYEVAVRVWLADDRIHDVLPYFCNSERSERRTAPERRAAQRR